MKRLLLALCVWLLLGGVSFATSFGSSSANLFGDGSDGAFATDGTAQDTLDAIGWTIIKEYTNFTVNVGHTFTIDQVTLGLIIYVNGTATINGKINGKGLGASDVNNTGYASVVSDFGKKFSPIIHAGGGHVYYDTTSQAVCVAGGNGAASGGSAGSGNSGAWSGGGGGGGGSEGNDGDCIGDNGNDAPYSAGGAGGAEACPNGGNGGSGGNAGLGIYIIARHIVLGASSEIDIRGNDGTNGAVGTASTGGGGGGGGGGLYCLVYQAKTSAGGDTHGWGTVTDAAASGGTGAPAGTNGSVGNGYAIQVTDF